MKKNPAKRCPPPYPSILTALRRAIKRLPDMNASRVVALHQKVMDGRYRTDPKRIADKILAFEAMLNEAASDKPDGEGRD